MCSARLGALISKCLRHFSRGLGILPVPRDTDKSCVHCQHSALQKQIAPRDLVPRDLLRGISRWKHHGKFQ